jgi:hypothetical protein
MVTTVSCTATECVQLFNISNKELEKAQAKRVDVIKTSRWCGGAAWCRSRCPGRRRGRAASGLATQKTLSRPPRVSLRRRRRRNRFGEQSGTQGVNITHLCHRSGTQASARTATGGSSCTPPGGKGIMRGETKRSAERTKVCTQGKRSEREK